MQRKILFIDDSEMMLVFLSNYFGQYYVVHAAETAEKAWSWLDEGNFPSLIILDLKMPGMSGYEFLNHLKYSVLFHDIPVIILSSIDNSKERIKCLESGAADYIIKPFNPQELSIKIKFHLGLSKV